jgi:Flp pilus assembly protein TadB
MTEKHDHGAGHSGRSSGPGRVERGDRGDHRWMMIACCAPMLILVVVLVVVGIVSPIFLIVAFVFAVTMALIMGGTHGGTRHQ